jgi:hypothetical protein
VRIAFATCSALPQGWIDDHAAAALVAAEYRCWDDPGVDWEAYDRVVIRSTWDYSGRLGEFLAWCDAVGPARLRNRPELVAFNADKRYLSDLAAPTVPTRFIAPGEPIPGLDGEIVVKPNVSAGARDTGRFGPATHEHAKALIRRINASGRVALLQPYMSLVERRGETALVFTSGRLSHVLHKRAVLEPDEVAPTTGPLGVAEAMLAEDLVSAGSATAAERGLAGRVMKELRSGFGTPLYARVDMVAGPAGEPLLIELEAVEPNLYMGTSPGASERFAESVLED